ncbi:acyl-CoA N-acyltransferase [Pisolithus marmoratus]|nr:acyl-CoA N-acyltransferase [Pisolithus marmoratus]
MFSWQECVFPTLMAFVNNCKPRTPILDYECYGPEPYDVNFVFHVPPALSSDKLRLVPFVPRLHAAAYVDGVRGYESMYQHMPHALEHPSDFLRLTEDFRRRANNILFAIIDTTHPDVNHPAWGGSIAGMVGLLDTSVDHLVTEIGPVIVLPAFQRTHVGSHAVGLLLKYTLELPPAGLGLRRVKWCASPLNISSNNLAKRMGFKFEGVSRWKFALPRVEGYPKVGTEGREGDGGNGRLGRDSNEYAVCWDDWENGGRTIVENVLAR